jgi:hypothetical protein
MSDKEHTITLTEGEIARLEREQTPGEKPLPTKHGFQIRHYDKNGDDKGLYTYRDASGKEQPVIIYSDNPTLVINGDGKAAEVIVPANIDLAPTFIPRLQIDTADITVTGGSFISAKESAHPALVAATPAGVGNLLTREDGYPPAPENALHFNNGKDSRYATDAQILTYQDIDERNRTIAIEKDGPGIQIVNWQDKTKLIVISGQDREKAAQDYKTLVADTKTAVSAASTDQEKKRLGIFRSVSTEISLQRQDALRDAAIRLKELSRNPMLTKQEGMPALLHQAQDAVTHIMRSDNSIDPAKVKEFHQAMDNLIERADAMEKSPAHTQALGRLMKEKFTEIKTNFGKVDGLKVSLLPSAQEQALAAVHPSLAKQIATEANHDLKTPQVAFAHAPQSKGPLLG